MNFKTFDIIKELENKLSTGYNLSIFKGYIAVDKRGVEKLIDELYANLPVDVKNARTYLKNSGADLLQNESKSNSSIYENLESFDEKLFNSFQIAKYVILNVKEIEKILGQISDNVPEEIQKARILDK